jgi:hypothetical protein
MEVQVDSHERPDGSLVPLRIHLGGRQIVVAQVLDEWPGADHRYVKARGEDGNLYILRFDAHRSTWDLILFSTPDGEGMLR